MLNVILPTHNPHAGRLARTLAALRAQSLPPDHWDLTLIDNASTSALSERLSGDPQLDVGWHSAVRIVRENQLGLTSARLRGFDETTGNGLVLVDDDNVLAPDYLSRAADVFASRPEVGVFGGKNLPEYEVPPPDWFDKIHGPLAVGDHGSNPLFARWNGEPHREYPPFAPVGAGLCLRREVATVWASETRRNPHRRSLDRAGDSLASGGDNDIVLTALEQGLSVAYFPDLTLTHLIPASRLTSGYHSRLLEASHRSWVVTLGLHGIRPWPPIHRGTLPLRKLRAALRTQPWRGTVPYLRYKAACGNLQGRADLHQLPLDAAPGSAGGRS